MIGEDIIDAFASLGDAGVLIALIVIVVIDGMGFPTLPEVWLVWLYGVNPDSLLWGAALVLVGSVAALGGNMGLYAVVRTVGMPSWIKKKMNQYTQFLIVKDERLLLLNKAAPIVPYTGAFIAACDWDLKKCTAYIIVGSVAKFAFIVLLAWLSYDNLERDLAPWVSMAIVAVILAASVVASLSYRRRHGVKEVPERSP